MPGGGELVIAINGGEITYRDPHYDSISLPDLHLVLPIRKTAKSVAENCLLATGARGRLLSGDFTGFIKRTDETGPPRNAALVTAWHASEVRIKRAIRG